jgi:hypothetical protein
MKRGDVFPSKYLKAEDLLGKPVTVTIETAPFETLKSPEGKEQGKIVLYFVGGKKCFPLNLTNWQSVSEICGNDTDDWPGGKIVLYPAKTQMGGKIVDCIRIRAPEQAALVTKPAKKPLPPADDTPDDDDDPSDSIPF